MPIHNWSRVEAGIFHHFHQAWTIEIGNALNHGLLPPGYFALAEQVIDGPIPDVVTLQWTSGSTASDKDLLNERGVAVEVAPPQAWLVTKAAIDQYAERANRIAIKHAMGHVVAVIEIVSPGNKNSHHALRSFATKAEELIRSGINLLVVDLFPPSARDPQGIHKAIWDQIVDEPFELPAGKRLTAVAYAASETKTAYVEPLAVGDTLPSLPIFLDPGRYVPAPLESTYAETWGKCPTQLREYVESQSN